MDESFEPELTPALVARTLAERKAAAVAARLSADALVIGADTIVAVPRAAAAGDDDYEILGKPTCPTDARRMLRALSGSRHQVLTGVAVARAPGGGGRSEVERTWVTMRPIADAEIEAYVGSGEWMDKAGGYAIQETADAFVARLEGGFDNVVGLPVELTLSLLRAVRGPLDVSAGTALEAPDPLAGPEAEG